mgnify:FL=1
MGAIRDFFLGENPTDVRVYAQLDEIRRHIRSISTDTKELRRLVMIMGETMAATQQEIDNLVGRVNAVETAVTDGVAGIRSDIETLKAENPGVDITALEASVAQLESGVTGLTTLDAENPAAPVEPTDPPVDEFR